MEKFSKGIFGNFNGKIGRVVAGEASNNMKSLPRINKNRQPSKQITIEGEGTSNSRIHV